MTSAADFYATLEKAKVPVETITFLRDELGVQSADHFADFAGKKELVGAAVTSDTHKPSAAVIATMKGVWRNCTAALERKIKRHTDGLPTEGIEEPLAPDIQSDIIATFLQYYNILDIDSRRICADPQFARFRRECQQSAPSNFAILRIKSLAAEQMAAPTKKERISDHMEITIADTTVDPEVKDLASWCRKLQIFCFPLAVVGCFAYEYVDAFGKKVTVMYAHLSYTDKYQYEFTEFVHKLRSRYADGAIRASISACEEQFRGWCEEMTKPQSVLRWFVC